jgi:hypothetical protein
MTLTAVNNFSGMLDGAVLLGTKYQANTDDLSKRVFRWIRETKEGAVGEDLAKRVDRLVTEVLVDLVRYRPLVEPVMDQEGFTWSRVLYDSYKEKYPVSPLSGKPFSAVVPHLFAEEMLALAHRVLPQGEGVLVRVEELEAPTTPAQMLQDYASTRYSLVAVRNRMLTELFTGVSERLGALQGVLQQRGDAEAERRVIEAGAHRVQVQQDLQVIDARHQGEIQQWGQIIEGREDALQRTKQKLEDRKAAVEQLRAENKNLRDEVGSLRAQLGK